MKSKCKSERGDVYERVTNQIIEAIERGAGQWRMPWHKLTSASAPVNAVSRKPYGSQLSLHALPHLYEHLIGSLEAEQACARVLNVEHHVYDDYGDRRKTEDVQPTPRWAARHPITS